MRQSRKVVAYYSDLHSIGEKPLILTIPEQLTVSFAKAYVVEVIAEKPDVISNPSGGGNDEAKEEEIPEKIRWV